MGSPSAHHILSNLTFAKTSLEIRTQARAKIERIQAKIAEREQRISTLRAAYEISDQDMIQLLSQQARNATSNSHVLSVTYNVGADENAKIIGAGVVQNLMTEQSLIEQERAQIARLEMVVSNLRPIRHHGANGEPYEVDTFDVSYSDLEFLGF